MTWILLLNLICSSDTYTYSYRYNSPATCKEAQAFYMDSNKNNWTCSVKAMCIVDADISN